MDRPCRRWTGRSSSLSVRVFVAGFALFAAVQLDARPDPHPVVAQLDSLFSAGEIDTLEQLVPILIEDARLQGDSTQVARLLVVQGRIALFSGQVTSAQNALGRAVRIAEAANDTLTWMTGLGFLGMAVGSTGQFDRSDALNTKRLELALETRDLVSEGWARTSLAFSHLARDEQIDARYQYTLAAECFQRADRPRAELTPLIGLGRVLVALGDVDAARDCYSRVRVTAHDVGDRTQEAHAWNNLGFLDFRNGDIGEAAQYFRKARELHKDTGSPWETVIATGNVALCYQYLGQYDRAEEILREALDICEAHGYTSIIGHPLNKLGLMQLEQERYHAAAALYRRVLALHDAVLAEYLHDAQLGLSMALAEMDSVESAVTLLEGTLERMEEFPNAAYEPRLLLELARLEHIQGHRRKALIDCKRVEALTMGLQDDRLRITVLFQLSMCYRAVDQPDSALFWFYEGMEALEADRGDMADFEWREAYGHRMVENLTNALHVVYEYPPGVDPQERAAAMFNVVQRCKAKTLAERIVEPRSMGTNMSGLLQTAPVTLSELQLSFLNADQLLLDFMVSDDVSYLFAVTRDECRVVELPGGRSTLPERVELFRAVTGTRPETEPADTRGMQVSLGRAILSDVTDLIAGHRQLFVSPDEFLLSLPFGAIAHETGAPLAETHDLVYLPSATVLKYLREQHHPRASGNLLALAASGKGRLLGAIDEVRHLDRWYENVDLVWADESPAKILEQFKGYETIHIAAHSEADDKRPWQSSIRIAAADATDDDPTAGDGTEPSTRQSEGNILAADIAILDLDARLAVLSACESALGRESRGEGVIGLTSAFVSAGVPAVVASLWSVDDRVTAELMKGFYRSLASGQSVAAALGQAQRGLRQEETTSHPFYWAGFIVVGDGTGTIQLGERRAAGFSRWITLALLAIIVTVVARRALRRRADIDF